MASETRPSRVFVHVGLPKTGTTFLQDLLRAHRSALRDAGLWYPDDGHRDHFFAALDARGDHTFAGAVRPAAREAWPKLVRLAMDFDGTVVVGHEVLATAPADRARAALEAFGDTEVHVVVTARDPARQVVADWQESVKHGRRQRFDQFVRNAGLSGEDAGDDTGVFRGQRLPDVLTAWGDPLPSKQVHVVTVPPTGAEPGLLWRRFATVVGVPDPDRFAAGDDVRANPSLGVADIEVMRRVGTFLDGRLVGNEFGAIAKNLYAQTILPRVSRTPAPVAPATLSPTLESLAESWIATINDRGYDVCGDLAELRPRVSEGRSPDDWENEEILDTAAAATAELLLEVAQLRRRRPAPPDARERRRLHRVLSGVARRLRRA